MMLFKKIYCIAVCVCFFVFSAYGRSGLSPFAFGLSEAKTGEERYAILYNTHKAACDLGVNVDYSGIRDVEITIPEGAPSIPLTTLNDFCGVVFRVTNTSKDFYLFSYLPKSQPIVVTKKAIDDSRFYDNRVLSSGKHLLVVSDNNKWVESRSGHNYGHVRKDVILINNGKGHNHPIMPYDNVQSNPSCVVYDLPNERFLFKNISFKRAPLSTHKTFLCNISGVNNLSIENVTITTPESTLSGDQAIRITNSTNVKLNKVAINGTYSQKQQFGYGVSLDNVWNLTVANMKGKGNWGVFGNNNINTATVKDSEINRFDIHCYGRDVKFLGVVFRDLYNQFSSTYGTIQFERCEFIGFTPVLYETSYNSYVGHDLVFKKCTFHLNKNHFYLVDAGYFSNIINQRAELMEKCLPNVTINKLSVLVEDDVDEMDIFKLTKEKSYDSEIAYLSGININGIECKYLRAGEPINISLVNADVNTINNLTISIRKVNALISGKTNAANSGGNIRTRLNATNGRNSISVKRSRLSNAGSIK